LHNATNNKMKANNRFAINDLIDNAVSNAVARRNEALSTVSNEESEKVIGGSIVASPSLSIPVITSGIISNPNAESTL